MQKKTVFTSLWGGGKLEWIRGKQIKGWMRLLKCIEKKLLSEYCFNRTL